MKAEELQRTLTEMRRDYTVVKRIGEGAFGEVWLLRDNALNRAEVVKTIEKSRLGNNSKSLWEFEFAGIKAYAKKIASHPNLITVHDAVETKECLFYFMEAADNVPGDSSVAYRPDSLLSRVNRLSMQGKRMPPEEVKRVMLGLLDGVQTLHANGLQHRDIKLENVVFVNGIVKLTDMGGVAEIGERERMVSSATYTPAYAGKGEYDPVDHDLYALGKILYSCLTGNDPADFPNLPEDFLDDPLCARLNVFLLKGACADERELRCKSAEEFRRRLLAAWKEPRRFRPWMVAAAAGAAAVVAVAVFCFRPAQKPIFSSPTMGFERGFCSFGDSSLAQEKDGLRWSVQEDQRFACCLFAFRSITLPPEMDVTFEVSAGIKKFDFETCFYSSSLGAVVNLASAWQKRTLNCRWLRINVRNGLAEMSSQVSNGHTDEIAVLNPPLRMKSGGEWSEIRVRRRYLPGKRACTVEISMDGQIAATQGDPLPDGAIFCMFFRGASSGTMLFRNLSIKRENQRE